MKFLLVVWLLLGQVPHYPPAAGRVASAYASHHACRRALKLWRGLDAAVCAPTLVRKRAA